jgi:hypothetical protein
MVVPTTFALIFLCLSFAIFGKVSSFGFNITLYYSNGIVVSKNLCADLYEKNICYFCYSCHHSICCHEHMSNLFWWLIWTKPSGCSECISNSSEAF